MQTFKSGFKYQSYHRKYINWQRKIWELYQMLPLAKKALWALFIKFLYFLYFKIVVILHMRLKCTTLEMIYISTMYIPMQTFTYPCEHYISLWIYFPCERPWGKRSTHHTSAIHVFPENLSCVVLFQSSLVIADHFQLLLYCYKCFQHGNFIIITDNFSIKISWECDSVFIFFTQVTFLWSFTWGFCAWVLFWLVFRWSEYISYCGTWAKGLFLQSFTFTDARHHLLSTCNDFLH